VMSGIDELTDLLVQASDWFTSLKTGVDATVPLEGGAELAFTRKGGVWGLYIFRSPPNPGADSILPIAEAGKAYRVLAASKLDDLLVALRCAQLEEERRIAAACEQVCDFLVRRKAER